MLSFLSKVCWLAIAVMVAGLALPERAVMVGSAESAQVYGLYECEHLAFVDCLIAVSEGEKCLEPCNGGSETFCSAAQLKCNYFASGP